MLTVMKMSVKLCVEACFICSKKKKLSGKNYLNYRDTVLAFFSLPKEGERKTNHLERKNGSKQVKFNV